MTDVHTPGQTDQTPAPDWRELRREERERRRAARRSGTGAWIGGVVLILLGVVFLLQNLGALELDNWWALFILIPAIGSFAGAWNAYRNSGGQLTGTVIGPLIGGLVLTAVAAAFLFELDWGKIWPLFIILAGIGALVGALARQE